MSHNDCRVVLLGIDRELFDRCTAALDGLATVTEVETVAALRRWPGNVVLMTSEVLIQRGLAAVDLVRQIAPGVPLVLVTQPEQQSVLARSLDERFEDVWSRSSLSAELVASVRTWCDDPMSPHDWDDAVPVAPEGTGGASQRRSFRVVTVDRYRPRALLLAPDGEVPVRIVNLSVANRGASGGLLLRGRGADSPRIHLSELLERRDFGLVVELPENPAPPFRLRARLVGQVRITSAGDVLLACTYEAPSEGVRADLLEFWAESQKRGLERWGRLPGAMVASPSLRAAPLRG